MRYLILTTLLTLLAENICYAQAGGNVQPSVGEWGKVIFDSKPTCSVTDPQNNYSNVIIRTSEKHFREKEVNGKKYQITYTITKLLTYSKVNNTLTEDSTIKINQWYINGKVDPSGLIDIDYPIWQENHNQVVPMSEQEFRKKNKELLPPPVQDWNTSASTSPTVEAKFDKDPSITITKTSYITKETDYQGQHLKIRYRNVVVTTYDKSAHTQNTTETIDNIEEVEVNVHGTDVPWMVNGHSYRIHLEGTNKRIDDLPAGPYFRLPIPPYLVIRLWPTITVENQSVSWDVKNINYLRKTYQDLCWQYIHRPVFTLTANYTPSYAYRSNRVIEQQFTHAADQQSRNTSEEGRYGQAFELHLGGTWSRTHTWYLGYMYLQNGFQQTGNPGTIDWTTGLYGNDTSKPGLAFVYHGFSLGYNYTGYNSHHLASGIFDGSIFYLFRNQPSNEGLRKHQFGVKLSAGISLRPNYYWDFHFMPTFLYDISSINKGSVLRSNLFNVGITAGITIRGAFSQKSGKFKLQLPN